VNNFGLNDSYYFKIDNSLPVVNINSPGAIIYSTTSINFNITATDPLDISLCGYVLDGGLLTALENFEGDNWNASEPSISEGVHEIIFYCNDTAGNLASSTFYFTITLPIVSIDGGGGSSGGGSSITENYTIPPIEKSFTISLGKVTAYEKIASVIDVAGIELTRTTIETNENVSSASIMIKTVSKILNVNLLVGLDQNNIYQGFQIQKTGLTDENLGEVLLEFKVEKSWLKGRDVSSITLQRKADGSTEWEKLNTTLISEDDTYYYFKSVSSGFSVFVIYFDVNLCTPGELFCYGNEIRLCRDQSDYFVVEYCEFGCSLGKCLQYWEPDEEESVMQRVIKLIFGTWLTFGTLVFMIIVAIILLSLVLVSFITYKYFERFGKNNKPRGVEY
jgi:PGF-pre-PGF domain-containing protein